jgi:hypothetical protein
VPIEEEEEEEMLHVNQQRTVILSLSSSGKVIGEVEIIGIK